MPHGDPGTAAPEATMRSASASPGFLLRLYRALHPEERLLAVIAVVVALACFSTGTGFTVHQVLDGYDNLFAFNLVLILVASRLVLAWRRSRPATGAWLDRINLDADLGLLRSTAFVMAYITLYTNVKVRIPAFNGEIHDWALRSFDRSLLFGFDPVPFFRSFQRWPDVTWFLDHVYHHDYIFMTLATLLLFLNNGPRHVRHLVTSMGLLYLGGVTITALWPTLGPCFWEAPRYKWLAWQELESAESQDMLRRNYDKAVAAAAEPTTYNAKAFTGIAAFPSLHVAHCLLLVRFAWTYHRRLVWLFLPVTLLTWVATLVFGWHYLSDGLVAPLLVALAWAGSKRLVFGATWAPVDPPPAS